MRVGKLFYIVAIIPFLMASTYSFAEMKRDWVDGKSISYPEHQYLVGVGYGNTREIAERNSYAAISRIFSTDITSINKDYEKYSQVRSEGQNKTKDENEINIEQFIEITTKRVLENVTIAETWFDSKEKVYYVLAVIEREKAGNSLKEQIHSLDSQIEEMIKKSRNTMDKIQKIRSLKAAIKGLIQREACNANLRVINLSGQGIDSPFNLAELDNDLNSFLKNDFSIGVEVTGEKGGRVEVAIIEGLNKQGLLIVKKGQPEDLIVKGEIEFSEAYIHNPMFKFVRWTANFKLIDKSTDRIIGSITRSGKEGHLTVIEAKERALKTLQEDIVSEVSKKLTEFIYGND
jgi:hypothetical protein